MKTCGHNIVPQPAACQYRKSIWPIRIAHPRDGLGMTLEEAEAAMEYIEQRNMAAAARKDVRSVKWPTKSRSGVSQNTVRNMVSTGKPVSSPARCDDTQEQSRCTFNNPGKWRNER